MFREIPVGVPSTRIFARGVSDPARRPGDGTAEQAGPDLLFCRVDRSGHTAIPAVDGAHASLVTTVW
ncbi:hypothetical protein [Streptomyces sp. NBC_01481]|uniref:hypothetical protein n=1 Tax=Streptomyces sp. NBC_01481 TaxID=2975869 RepID=UPI0022532CDA|nr:hypothetical protein [Streptomyces sp. NBC_01481]MCX4586147.1 hypothetical protein [Streptomyces sp. NBC_01481]